MGLSHSPKIVINGLIMYVDAANVKSYPGSGATWFDLTKNNNHLTLIDSPVFTSGVARFNGTSQYATNNLNLSTGTSTIFASSRQLGGKNGRSISAVSNNWLLGHYYTSGSTENYFSGSGWITGSAAGPADTNWRIYAGTADTVADRYSFYVNGVKRVANSTAGSGGGPNGVSIARSGVFTGEISNCEVGFVLAYNRVLTDEEVLQNFSAFRGRFGI